MMPACCCWGRKQAGPRKPGMRPKGLFRAKANWRAGSAAGVPTGFRRGLAIGSGTRDNYFEMGCNDTSRDLVVVGGQTLTNTGTGWANCLC